MFDQAKISLKKFKGDTVGSPMGENGACGGVSGPAIKLEPAFYTGTRHPTGSQGRGWRGMNKQSRGMFRYGAARGYLPSRGGATQRGTPSTMFKSYGSREGPNATSWRGRTEVPWKNRTGEKDLNPSGLDGRPLKCSSCESIRHFVKDCPHSWENAAINRVNMVEGHEGLTQDWVS